MLYYFIIIPNKHQTDTIFDGEMVKQLEFTKTKKFSYIENANNTAIIVTLKNFRYLQVKKVVRSH